MLALFTPTKLPPSHNTTPSNLNTLAKKKKHVDDVLMCFPSTLLHQSSVYLMKAKMQSWGGFRWNSLHCSSSHCMHMASCSFKEFGAFIVLSSIAPMSRCIDELECSLVSWLFQCSVCRLVLFLTTTVSLSTLSQQLCFASDNWSLMWFCNNGSNCQCYR